MKANAMNGARKGERRYERAIDWLLDALNDKRTPMDTKVKIALALVRIQASGAGREGAKRIAPGALRSRRAAAAASSLRRARRRGLFR